MKDVRQKSGCLIVATDRPLFSSISVARIALVSQDRARQIEAILLRMAQTGQLRGRVTEEQLIDLLEKVRISWTMSMYQPVQSRRHATGRRCAVERAAQEGHNCGECGNTTHVSEVN